MFENLPQVQRPLGRTHGTHRKAGELDAAEFWLNLQSLYALRVAEAKTGKAVKKLPTLKHLEEAHV